jgi:predicted SnoaL-like aldol condensation-catalyzing enzyme
MGTPEENKALVLRFIDALSKGDVAGAAACFDAERYYSHAYEADLAGTWEQQKANYRSGTWSDVETERLAVIADGDRVAYLANFTGTHTGPFLGIPPSGRRVTIPMLETWRIDGDKIVEHWGGFQITERLLARLRGDAS